MSESRERHRSQAQDQNVIVGEVRNRRSRYYSLADEAFRYDNTIEYKKHKGVVIGKIYQEC